MTDTIIIAWFMGATTALIGVGVVIYYSATTHWVLNHWKKKCKGKGGRRYENLLH